MSRAAARAEFKSIMQGDKESSIEFSRRVISLGDVANVIMGAQTRDDMNCEQFIDGIFDAELQELLLCEELENFTQAVARAQFLEFAKTNGQSEEQETIKLCSRIAECTRLDVWSGQRRCRGR